MKIKNVKVKEILESVIKELKDARCNTYNNGSLSRQEISNVIGKLQTLTTVVDFSED